MKDSSTIRNVAFNVAEVVHCAQFVCLNYLQRFYAEMNDEVKAYKETHEHGDNFSVIIDENWLKEAAKTGRIFPVNPMVRPSIDFGQSKCTEIQEFAVKIMDHRDIYCAMCMQVSKIDRLIFNRATQS